MPIERLTPEAEVFDIILLVLGILLMSITVNISTKPGATDNPLGFFLIMSPFIAITFMLDRTIVTDHTSYLWNEGIV